MKTKEQVIAAIKAGRKSECIDERDYGRLCIFLTQDEMTQIGFSLWKNRPEPPRDWTEKNIREQLGKDVSFGFEKALDQRGISAGLMYEVVKMWMWVLDDELQRSEEYAQYGLPLFKAVAVKYKFPNPISNDIGNEHKYACEEE